MPLSFMKGKDMNIADVQVGNIVVCFDEYSHDYVQHEMLVESKELITETNPEGVVLYGTDLTDDNEETMICRVDESNFVV